jgi:hypothetical protein
MPILGGNKTYKADISISASGDNTIIAAPGDGRYIAVDHINLFPAAAVTVQFKDGATNYGGSYPLDTKQPITLENAISDQDGIITMSNNSAFVINLSGAVAVTGFVRYRIV